jgi:hypothetical protein
VYIWLAENILKPWYFGQQSPAGWSAGDYGRHSVSQVPVFPTMEQVNVCVSRAPHAASPRMTLKCAHASSTSLS